MCHSDLLIIGGGPAGLSAAINGASEGLTVRLLDSGPSLGGQARESSAIENYPGFPEGITGNELMHTFVKQALKFRTNILCPVSASKLAVDGKRFSVLTDDYQEFTARAVLLSSGLSYRRHMAEGIGPLMGRGVFYGMPPGKFAPTRKCNVAVVGGANSAGQAALKFAQNTNATVYMIIRKNLDAQMSTYLIERLRALPNVHICEGCEITSVHGEKSLESVTTKLADGRTDEMAMNFMFIFIGATPRTLWVRDVITLDERHFVKTWNDLPDGDTRLPYETSVPGVFAAGDVRLGSTKRIATAIGEGAGALSMIHRRLAEGS